MPKLTILPHEVICPKGALIEASEGETILNAALSSGISIEHACEKSCACTTCHVIVREGFFSMEGAEENEEDYLDCLLYTSPSPRDKRQSRMPSSA